MTDLDQVRRDDLTGVPAALATALDAWLFRTHGVASGGHNTGTFLDELAASGLAVVEQTDAVVFVAHRRLEDGSCLCGWRELGRSHLAHVDEAMRAAAAARQ